MLSEASKGRHPRTTDRILAACPKASLSSSMVDGVCLYIPPPGSEDRGLCLSIKTDSCQVSVFIRSLFNTDFQTMPNMW